jgi:hypothetical protein
VTVAGKVEGTALGSRIDGGLWFGVVTDNDVSVTQSGSGKQRDLFTDGDRSLFTPGNAGCRLPGRPGADPER